MNEICAELHLGPEAISYIRERLAHGKTLARYLLERPDLENGTVTTFLPSDVSEEAATQFKWGGKLKRDPETFVYRTAPDGAAVRWEPVPNTDPWLVSTVQTFLRATEERVCVFENALARPSDPYVSSLKSQLLTFEDEVYHVLFSKEARTRKIAQAIREAGCAYPPLIGAMTSLSKASELPLEAGTVDDEVLKTFAQRAEKIVVGAYDGESYLVWSKPAS